MKKKRDTITKKTKSKCLKFETKGISDLISSVFIRFSHDQPFFEKILYMQAGGFCENKFYFN